MSLIFYSGSITDYEKNIQTYDLFKSVANEQKVKYISVHDEGYDEVLGSKATLGQTPEERHYLFVNKSISIADASIIEVSRDTFRLGHEATLTLMHSKPVLCVSRKRDYSQYIKHPLFYAYMYESVDELREVFINFIKEVENNSLTVRFNGMLSPHQKLFLDWLSKHENRSVSEIIRDLIEREMKNRRGFKSDHKWLIRKYLKNI